MEQSDSIANLATALATANLTLKNAVLDCKNNHFNGRYASLGSITDAIREPLAKHGIVVTQGVRLTSDGWVEVTTLMMHKSGEWLKEQTCFPMHDKPKVQELGGLITYLRRYTLAAMFNITGDEDTDAEEDRVAERSASVRKPAQARTSRPATPAPPAPPQEATKDKYPDEGEVRVKVIRVIERVGKKVAIMVENKAFGAAFVTADIPEYVQVMKDMIGDEVTLSLMRINNALTITNIKSMPKQEQPPEEEIMEKHDSIPGEDIPF